MKKVNDTAKIQSLTDQLSQAKELAEAFRNERDRVEQRARDNVKHVGELKETVSSLKSDLASALETIALQRGYLARVGEDDTLRDGGKFVETSLISKEMQLIRQGPGQASPLHATASCDFETYQGERLETVRPYQKPWFER